MELLANLTLAVFELFEVYEGTVTVKSHDDRNSSQINHKTVFYMAIVLRKVNDEKRKTVSMPGIQAGWF